MHVATRCCRCEQKNYFPKTKIILVTIHVTPTDKNCQSGHVGSCREDSFLPVSFPREYGKDMKLKGKLMAPIKKNLLARFLG